MRKIFYIGELTEAATCQINRTRLLEQWRHSLLNLCKVITYTQNTFRQRSVP